MTQVSIGGQPVQVRVTSLTIGGVQAQAAAEAAIVSIANSVAAAETAETNAETAEAAAEAAQAAAEAAAAEATGGLFKTVSATTYTLLEADNRYSIRFTAATAVTVTVPAGLTHHFLVGIRQAGLGQVTVSPAMGVTIANADDAFTTESEGVILSLSSSASNTYDLDGRTV